ncbi:MAG TPA: hypothetical protein VHZ78_12435 [Rhizomicrobium sp.]|jgi:hypothetical protein|nr:hypothetical protein [Rhizomicrobium sp.]
MRILIAGLLGGLAMYVWLSVAHMSPLGQIGVHALPGGEAMITQIADAAGNKAGLYFVPDHMSAKPSAAVGPFALVSFTPRAPTGLSPAQLTFEFLSELVEALVAAWLLAQAALATYGARVGFVTGIGVVAAILAEAPYWNWYSFPLDYSLVNAAMQIVGFFVAGLVMAWWLKPKAA